MVIAVAALVIVLSFELSLAQPEAPPSPRCIAAYNATFNDQTTASCPEASIALFFGTATDDQKMMVCSSGQQCNTMIENVIDVCGNTIDSPSRLTQDLLCAAGPNGTSCLTTFITAVADSDLLDLFETLGESCTGSCSPTCRKGLMQLNNTLGCCLVEVLQALVDSGETPVLFASLVANGYPEQCGLGMFTSCDGSVIPPDPCSNASIALFGQNDLCSGSLQELIFNDNDTALPDLFKGDCPTRFSAYINACSELFGDDNDQIMRFANGLVSLSQATDSNGRRCIELLPSLIPDRFEEDNEEINCVEDYFLGQCSTGCRNVLMDLIAQYGCCFNAALFFLTNNSDEVFLQIESAIITRELYSLCGLQSPGFCSGSDPPTYAAAAERCVSTRNSYFADDTCLGYYRTLGVRPSATEVNDAAFAICASQRCRNRMSSYSDYLTNCRIPINLNEEDDDDNDDGDEEEEEEEEDTSYLDFAYLTGNTTCRVDSSNISCYSSVFFNQQFSLVSAAFDNTLTGECVSSLVISCSDECTRVLTTAYDEVGCCLGEYGRVLLGNDIFNEVTSRCGVPSFSNRCTEIGSGANTQTGLGIIAISLLGVIAFMLF